MERQALRRITILGNDSIAWLVATALGKRLRGHRVSVSVVGEEPEPTNRIRATSPATNGFHRRIGIDEGRLLGTVRGAYSLGTRYVDWARPGDRYVHTFSPAGPMLRGVEFHHYVTFMRHAGVDLEFDRFNTAAHAVRNGRFGPATGDAIEPLVYGLQLEEAGYREFLRKSAESLGVTQITAGVGAAVKDSDSGCIEALILSDGRRVETDFVLDCGSDLSALLREEYGVGMTDWSQFFPSDREMAALSSHEGETPSCTSLTRRPTGWIRQTSVARNHWRSFAYSSAFIDDDSVFADGFVDTGPRHGSVAGGKEAEPQIIKRRLPQRGCLDAYWVANCLALGTAAGYSGDFLVSGLHLAQSGILRWLDLYPDRTCDSLLAAEFNRAAQEEMERVRDIHLLLLRTAHQDSDFWRAANAPELPESLHYRLAVFDAAGVLPTYESESVAHDAWVSLLMGMRLRPQRYDPLVEQSDLDTIARELRALEQSAEQAADLLPAHDVVLKQLSRPSLQELSNG